MSGIIPLHPWFGIVLLLAAIALLIAGLRFYQVRYQPDPEWVRKLFHMSSGTFALVAPWLFGQDWPVLVVLGFVAIVLFLFRVTRLKNGPGKILSDVSRYSFGEMYFVMSIAILLLFTEQEERVLYSISLIILTLADAIAALVGVRYGQVRYVVPEGMKSIEGSFAFFLVAFLSTHITLFLFFPMDGMANLMISITVSLLATLAESVSWGGKDNLVVPIVSFMMLKFLIVKDNAHLLLALTLALLLFILLEACRRTKVVCPQALMGISVISYVSWAIGGIDFLVVLLLHSVSSPIILKSSTELFSSKKIGLFIATYTMSFVWLFLYQQTQSEVFFFAFLIGLLAQSICFSLTEIFQSSQKRHLLIYLFLNILKNWGLTLTALVLRSGLSSEVVVHSIWAAVSMLMASGIYYLFVFKRSKAAVLIQPICAAVGSILGILLF
ncbi:diacylglycerol/polyprenol kinase family protein [Brevibacillus laterosporus]|uniref:Cytidylyltransferase family protein n=1 Tax=Brevibacillus laterosporus LMG 15441 TaxID=1042163 RepID=A0A075R4E1_BRELA|nr:cytidylyltransferase [Brevibacillus laterosporus]AIG26709.1 cytidylyltransferase family protein [Brevibacillus laterosporus LMG 15441]RJL14060.1 cytidylyltransferase [Brevibacillus laterosporus]